MENAVCGSGRYTRVAYCDIAAEERGIFLPVTVTNRTPDKLLFHPARSRQQIDSAAQRLSFMGTRAQMADISGSE